MIGVLFYLSYLMYWRIKNVVYFLYALFRVLAIRNFFGHDVGIASKTGVLSRCYGFAWMFYWSIGWILKCCYFPFWSVVIIYARVVEAKMEGYSLSEDEKGITCRWRTVMVWKKCWATLWLMTSFMQVNLFPCHEWAFDNDLEVWYESF